MSISSTIAKIEANDASLTSVSFAGNASFKMKPGEYVKRICAAMKNNTNVKELNLSSCDVIKSGAQDIADMLASNNTLVKLNLDKNKIDTDGMIVIAKSLAHNKSLEEIGLMAQSMKTGEPALTAFVETFETNTTLKSISWRLESRQSFKLNGCQTRNKEIARRKAAGLDVSDIDPIERRKKEAGENSAAAAAPEPAAAEPAPAAAAEPEPAAEEPAAAEEEPAAEPAAEEAAADE